MRFTTSKETGNPDPHLISISRNPTFVAVKEISEMFLKLTGNNVFFQLLLNIQIIILTNFNNTF